MGVDMRNIFIATILFFTTQSFADMAMVSPVQLKYFATDFYNLEKNEPNVSKLIGTWDCMGSAGYTKAGQCPIDQVRFAKINSTFGLTVIKGKKTYAPMDVMFEGWIMGLDRFADTKLYNHIVGKSPDRTKSEIILVGGVINNSWKSFTLNDCTSFGNEMLVCKTQGNSDDYKCSLPSGDPERCSVAYEQNMKANDQWSIFVKQGATNVPKISVKSYNDVKKKKS